MTKKKFEKIGRVVLILGGVSFIAIHLLLDFKKNRVFYKSKLNTKVVKIEGNWSGGRSFDYITEENVIITLLSNKHLNIGDSIVKEANSEVFQAYRKEFNGAYMPLDLDK